MLTFVLGIIFIIATVPVLLLIRRINAEYREDGYESLTVSPAWAVISLGIGVFLAGASCIFIQDVGEVVVLRNLGGSIEEKPSMDAGCHLKLPWQEAIPYDVRNNVISFLSDGQEDYMGGSATGSHVTINDAGGASADIDIQVNYSLDPNYATNLYKDYGTQEAFVKSVAAVDVRAVPREIAGQYDALTLLTNRGQFTAAVQEALAAKWEGYGLIVKQVSVQEIRYPESIMNQYAEAQQAEIARQKAENEQETAKVQAETKRIEAEGEAAANAILTESLTDEVLEQRYIDALKEIGANGNLVVVPEGGQPLVNTQR